MLAYDAIGASPACALLLHGLLGSARNLATLGRRLCERVPGLGILGVDLPGHGRSPPLADDARLTHAASEVAKLLDAQAGAAAEPPVHVIGHSLGGRVALRLLGDRPDLVWRVSLLDISPGPAYRDGLTGDTVARLLAAPSSFPDRTAARSFLLDQGMSAPIADWLLMNLRSERGREPAVAWRIDRVGLHRFIERTSTEDLWSVVEAWPTRVAAARGAASGYVTDLDFERLQTLGAGPLVTLRGAGHFVHVDALPELLDFLESAETQG